MVRLMLLISRLTNATLRYNLCKLSVLSSQDFNMAMGVLFLLSNVASGCCVVSSLTEFSISTNAAIIAKGATIAFAVILRPHL